MASRLFFYSMNMRPALTLLPFLALWIVPVISVPGQQHFATRLGNPATRFADPLQTPDDLRRMLTSAALRADLHSSACKSGYKSRAPQVETRCETRIEGVPEILIEVVDKIDPIDVGENETYDIKVLNKGSAILTNLNVVCMLAEGQEFVSGSGLSAVTAESHTVTLATVPASTPRILPCGG